MRRRSGILPFRVAAVAFVGTALLGVLAACAPTPQPTIPASESSAPTTEAPAAEAPTLHPDGTADDNLPLFTAVVEQVWASDQQVSGRAYIDALIAAGFDRAAMQLTPDQSTVGNPAESIQFSVRWGDSECLIGQVGPSTGAAVTVVMPQLAEGRCLVGTTRPIDW